MIFNSNRLAANAAQTAAAIEGAGLGPARHGETLYLQGDVAPGSAKDPRRAAISARYCVVAMAGDQLGDFSDLFNARTLSRAGSPPLRRHGPLRRPVGQWLVHALQPGLRPGHARQFRRCLPGRPPLDRSARRK